MPRCSSMRKRSAHLMIQGICTCTKVPVVVLEERASMLVAWAHAKSERHARRARRRAGAPPGGPCRSHPVRASPARPQRGRDASVAGAPSQRARCEREGEEGTQRPHAHSHLRSHHVHRVDPPTSDASRPRRARSRDIRSGWACPDPTAGSHTSVRGVHA